MKKHSDNLSSQPLFPAEQRQVDSIHRSEEIKASCPAEKKRPPARTSSRQPKVKLVSHKLF
jgi:hypothetical protein